MVVVLQVETRLADLVLSGDVLRRVADVFEQELDAGLKEQPSSLQMENTYVPELPDGTGTYSTFVGCTGTTVGCTAASAGCTGTFVGLAAAFAGNTATSAGCTVASARCTASCSFYQELESVMRGESSR